MKKSLTSLFSLLAITLLVVSCGSDNPLISQAKKSISSMDYDAALTAANEAIATTPDNADAYYYKGLALSAKAKNTPEPAERVSEYEEMRAALMKAKELYAAQGVNSKESLNITPTILSAWETEHNEAIKFATNDSIMAITQDPLKIAIAHLKNATIINPDSTLSFDVLSQVQYMDKDYEGAISSLSKSMELKNPPPSGDYSRLGNYYMLNEDYDSAVLTLEKGIEIYPDTITLVQQLADAYMSVGEMDKAITTVENLIATDPNNAQYHLVLGTQVYQTVIGMSETVSANYDQIFELRQQAKKLRGDEKTNVQQQIDAINAENVKLKAEISSLTDRAISELKKVINLQPDKPAGYNTLGIIYQNKSASLFEERNLTDDNDEAASLDEMARAELKKAMVNYEKAAELDPTNTNYWQSLFKVYTTLDMKEKADEAMNKAGM